MILFRSLRWQLQSYYALLLLLTLGVLTTLFSHWMRVSERHRYDSLLREYQHGLTPALRSPEPGNPGFWKQFDPLNFDRDRPRGPERGPVRGRDSGGPAGGPPGGPPVTPTEAVERLLDDGWYFGVFTFEGAPLRLSRTFPEDLELIFPSNDRGGDVLQDSGNYRSLLHREPGRLITVIGYSESRFAAEVWRRQWLLLAVTLSLFLAAASAGWWLIGRSLRPIQAIRKAADRVADGELSIRIDERPAQSNEIGELSENLNQTFARFESMFERQKRFTSEASHELRTPIAVILGYCQIALEKDRSPEQVQEAVLACRRAGMRMKNLTNDLLELARIESGEIHFEFSPCAIRDVAEEALELIAPLAEEKRIVLRADITDATITANGDRLWQVFVNLLNNAIRHTPDGKSITLKTVVAGPCLEVHVIDEGEGIPAADLPHIFERFYRVDSSRNRKTGGSGLGLAISETIIKAHGGMIEARSDVGKGATFVIRLPRGGPASD